LIARRVGRRADSVDRYRPGNRIRLLRNGAEYFAALEGAIDAARQEVWLESYIFADDAAGRRIAAAMARAAGRGVKVRVMVDGWGARFYLTSSLETFMRDAGVELLKYRPEVSAWQFRSHRLRRLHRKLVHVDGRVAFVGGINIIDDMNTRGQKAPRVDFAVSVEGLLLPAIVHTMQRVWALVQLVQLGASQMPLFPERVRGERVSLPGARRTAADVDGGGERSRSDQRRDTGRGPLIGRVPDREPRDVGNQVQGSGAHGPLLKS